MPGPTFTLIQGSTITSNQSSIVLGSGGTIPQTFTDLVIMASTRTNRSNATFDDLYIGLNGSFTGNVRVLYGAIGATPAVQGYTAGAACAGIATAADGALSNVFGNAYIHIPNYTQAINHPFNVQAGTANNSGTAGLGLSAINWTNASQAVTSITLEPGDGSVFIAGSSAFLYGINNS